ncbi:MAG: hypothetical protein A2406_01835 [Candidatus Komeilibacteria bacterium RIFOXYC1_FULL_37_11]|uniref:Adenylate kinase n=1 Tax=Candidatus Komeilibacteria bacterium RIFOXYC1_FULL_37_11 TaxID=1798555 RepID=A0A1G2C1B2_9BACT|nr:MAG: hypothetical protein A2406_01835 [Candidatus Komeilibacteria bacterium RIFOXYC1_FULL_37_11]OGY95588.1 MAG: hypothetical protein A2611_01540 [Candidatus Komeilibacteria bacterium RIFOXYD1_FULL_37_29]
MKRIVLLGPQASGKSTQSKVITDFLKIPLVSASHSLRKMIGRGTVLGKKIKELMDQGSLVPDDQMISLILGELGSEYCLNGYLLDGFPRNIRQAQVLDSSCGVDKVFNIEISDEEAIKRMAGRRMCSNGHVFHIKFKPSGKGDICDICDQELYQREDDKEEIVKKRLGIYRRDTSKLLDYYDKQNKLVSFDGEKDISEVSEDILNYLKANVG